MYVFKWRYPQMLFSPDDGGGAAPSASPSGGGGDGGGGGTTASPAGSSVASPSPSTDGGGGVSGSPAPAASPAPATPEAAAPDWSNLGSSDDLDFIEIQADAATKAAQPSAVTPPQPQQPAPVAPAPQAPVAPSPAAQPQPPAEGEARPLSAAEPWRIAEGIEANREAITTHLAQTKFALSEEDIRDLDTDVNVAVPKLLARVFLESQVSMQKFLAQAVPGMIKQYNTVTSANQGAEEKFFKAHAALDRNNPQHRQTAVRIASLYRQANPGIPLDQLIQEVGPMVMASLRINAPPAAPAGVLPAAPAALAPRGGTPFRPAVNGGGGAPIAAEPPSEWAGLGQNYD